MNKKFLSAILFGALMVTSTGTFVSCKDYDEDVENLQTQVDTNKSAISALESQLSSLNNAGADAKAKAESALAKAEAAKAAGDKATAAAEEAKAAVAQAKAEAIAETIAQVEALIKAANEMNAEALNAAIQVVAGRVDGLEADLAETIKSLVAADQQSLTAIMALIEDLDVQKAALEKMEALLGSSSSNEALKAEIDGMKADLETIVVELDNKIGEVAKVANRVDDLEEALAAQFESQQEWVNIVANAAQALADDMGAANEQIDELWAEINGEGANSIRTQLGQLALQLGDLNTLHTMVGRRLTSTVFVPDFYVDGIPTIKFTTLMYDPQAFDPTHAEGSYNAQNEGSTTEAIAKTMYISNKNTTAKYRLNPTGVFPEDIKLPSFICMTAENQTRGANSAEKVNSPVGVVQGQDINIDKENDLLILKIEKTDLTQPLYGSDWSKETPLEVEKFYQVALKTPIADQHLTEGETEAYVYSEYVRVAEVTVRPYLEKVLESTKGGVVEEYKALEAFAAAKTNTEAPANGDGTEITTDQHYVDSVSLYRSNPGEMISWKIPYDQKVDLNKLVYACELPVGEFDPAKMHNKLDMDAYGLEFRFAIAEKECITIAGDDENSNGTDQQKFAEINGSILSSKVYTVGQGGTSVTAVGREPIIRIELRDKANDKLIAQRYMKIKWVKETAKKEVTFDQFVENFDCAGFEGRIKTQPMNEKIYHFMGMTKKEFHAVYTNIEKVSGIGSVEEVINKEEGVESYNIVWSMTSVEVGAIWTALYKDSYKITFKYTDPTGEHPELYINLSAKIVMPTVGVWGHNLVYWKNDNYFTFKVNPIVYKNSEAEATCNIWTNLLNGFVDKNQKFPATGELADVLWSAFDNKKEAYAFEPAGLRFELDVEKLNKEPYIYYDEDGKKMTATWSEDKTILYLDKIDAAYIYNTDGSEFRAENYNIVLAEEEASYEGDYTETANPTKAAKALVGKEIPMKIVADLCGDNLNVNTVKAYEAHIIEPLTMDPKVEGEWTDAEIDGSRVGINGVEVYKDWNNYFVCSDATMTAGRKDGRTGYEEELYQYYKVKELVWPIDDEEKLSLHATTNLVNDGKGNLIPGNTEEGLLPSNVTITLDKVNNELVYWNHSGTPVNTAYNVYITIEGGYKWQTIKKKLCIKVNPSAGSVN